MDLKQTTEIGNAGYPVGMATVRRWLMGRARREAGALWALPIMLLALVFGSLWSAVPDARATVDQSPLAIVVDTDTGVDDATAIAWLLTQTERPVKFLGFAAVAGNATVENAANNVLTVLDAAGRPNIPVVIGADRPLIRPLSQLGSLIHGPDGLWFTGLRNPHDLFRLPRDVPAFYRDLAQAQPGATLIALGPLTNLAHTLDRYPAALHRFGRIIVLGGSKLGGNRTPVAETNIFIDPEAAQRVLAADLPLTIITLDAFTEVTISESEIARLAQSSLPVSQLIAGPLESYRQILTLGATGQDVGVPDVAAAMYAVDPSRGDEQSALVKAITDSRLARGQTIIGTTFTDRLTMVASDRELSRLAERVLNDSNFNLVAAIAAILAREPDNAQVVLDVDGKEMQRRLIRTLTR